MFHFGRFNVYPAEGRGTARRAPALQWSPWWRGGRADGRVGKAFVVPRAPAPASMRPACAIGRANNVTNYKGAAPLCAGGRPAAQRQRQKVVKGELRADQPAVIAHYGGAGTLHCPFDIADTGGIADGVDSEPFCRQPVGQRQVARRPIATTT